MAVGAGRVRHGVVGHRMTARLLELPFTAAAAMARRRLGWRWPRAMDSARVALSPRIARRRRRQRLLRRRRRSVDRPVPAPRAAGRRGVVAPVMSRHLARTAKVSTRRAATPPGRCFRRVARARQRAGAQPAGVRARLVDTLYQIAFVPVALVLLWRRSRGDRVGSAWSRSPGPVPRHPLRGLVLGPATRLDVLPRAGGGGVCQHCRAPPRAPAGGGGMSRLVIAALVLLLTVGALFGAAAWNRGGAVQRSC